jgi:hypothetical protein
MTPSLQLLPMHAQPHSGLQFDLYQFQRRATRVSAETRLTFQDAVHVERRSTYRQARWKPAFANNAAQLRKVLAVAVWQSAHGRRAFPEGLESDLPRLKQIAKNAVGRWNRTLAQDQKRRRWHHKSLSKHQRAIISRHVFTEAWSGGTLHSFAAIAYLSWHRGLSSCEVASQLYMTPWGVRMIRYRLCNIARGLRFATFAPHHSRREAGNTVQAT